MMRPVLVEWPLKLRNKIKLNQSYNKSGTPEKVLTDSVMRTLQVFIKLAREDNE